MNAYTGSLLFVAQVSDSRLMACALKEAEKSLGLTSPNPAVGAVLVRDGKISAKGNHRGAGQPHAEIECLAGAPRKIGASTTLYVTLEPCSTRGRTPPCTDAIIASGVRTVVIGAIDPNPLHAGRGVQLLRAAGIAVRSGVLAEECTKLNEAFNKWIATRRPFVTAKCGMSLDGRLTRPPGESQWLTSSAARSHARNARAQVDAILVGAGTIRQDNPKLTIPPARRQKQQPLRVVLTRTGKLPPDAHILTDAHRDRTRVLRDLSLRDALAQLGEQDVTSVLIEGGGEILSEALKEKLIDKVAIYLAPIFSGGPTLAFGGLGAGETAAGVRLEKLQYERIGADIFVSGYPKYPEA